MQKIKVGAQAASESAKIAQSKQDWLSADMLAERDISGLSDRFRDCPLSACRRARCCDGNPPLCMRRIRPKCPIQNVVERFYAQIQQERRTAAAEHRAPNLPIPYTPMKQKGRK